MRGDMRGDMAKIENTDSLDTLPNANYEKMFIKFKEIDTIPIKSWTATHILGYFVKKYSSHYNVNYKFKFNTTLPSKSFEIFQVKKISSLLSSNPAIIKEYIDWVFDNKVKQAKRRLTSISFIAHEGVIQEYKDKFLFEDKTSIDRSTQLPDNILQILLNTKFFNVKTYGDLAFIKKINNDEVKSIFELIVNCGFDISILEKVK